jgi:hypothetical protein
MNDATSRLAATLALVLAAASAEAGTILGASGPFRLNGKQVTLEQGAGIPMPAGAKLETLGSEVSYRSDTGDAITFERDSVAVEQETTEFGSAVFLSRGSATATISDKTQIGTAVGWIGAPAGSRAKVLVEPAAGLETTEAFVRSVEGNSWIRYGVNAYAIALPQAHSVVLDVDPKAPGSFGFRTGQQNAGEVAIHRNVGGGQIIASVPKATSGAFTDVAGENKTKICNDINSLKTAKVRLTTRFSGKADNTAAIGPGTCAQIDNATGVIEVLFTAIKFEILERAISLTSEFGTLAQSNFSDVK